MRSGSHFGASHHCGEPAVSARHSMNHQDRQEDGVDAQAVSVGVIGGGLGGLAAACVSAARGHRVTLYDKNAWLGGKAAVLHESGFRFDMGPTILTVPRVLERIFAEAGRD